MTLVVVLSVVWAAFGALAVYGWWIGRTWALGGERPRRLEVTTADGWGLALWHRPAAVRRFGVPVVLCHGLANNHAFMDFRGERSLARYLAALGFDCYSVDLRGAGGTRPPDEGPWTVTFDDHVRHDVPAIVEAVLSHAGAQRLAWVGHSMGGLVALAAGPVLWDRLAALVTLGTPLYFRLPRALVWLIRLAAWLSPWGRFDATLPRFVAPFAGRAPAPALTAATANLRNITPEDQRFLVANVFAPIWRGVLLQLADWVGHDAFRSADGAHDYRAALARLGAPALVAGGTVDQLAPPDVVRDGFGLLGGERELVLFGRSYGQRAEYGHGDLLVGEHAPSEIYPVVGAFLERTLGGVVTSAAPAP